MYTFKSLYPLCIIIMCLLKICVCNTSKPPSESFLSSVKTFRHLSCVLMKSPLTHLYLALLALYIHAFLAIFINSTSS